MNDERLSKALALPPLTDKPMTFLEFLKELASDRKLADTAPAVVLRAIRDMGCEDIDAETDPERQTFLRTLRQAGIPSWKAFYHVCGSQLFAYRLVERFLKPAAANGAQLKKILIIEGGPGSGKDFFKDGVKLALEAHARVYAVKDCPDHENPVNLLKLLSEEQLKEVADIFEVEFDAVKDMLLAAGEPCQHCYSKVMGNLNQPNEQPNLSGIQVERIRLSERSAGVFEWKPGQDCSLVKALRRANRGFIAMPDAFLEREPEPGKTDERLILLDATQYRRLPGSDTCSKDPVSASPLDVFMLASTNERAFSKFLDTLPDRDAFTGRSEQLKLPYNLVRLEEERAYTQELARYKKTAEFGPLALRMIATLAVLSRYGVPKKDEHFVHPIDRMRLLQGERIRAKARPSSEWAEVWSLGSSTSSSSSSGYDSGGGRWNSSGYGASSSLSSRPSGGSAEIADSELKFTAISAPKDVMLSPMMMWQMIGPEEGLVGLDMRFMLNLLSRINSYGLSSEETKGKSKKGKRNVVTALESIMLLRNAISDKLNNTSNLTTEQKAVLQRCQKWLGGAPAASDETWASTASSKPGLIESEYRRLLKQQLLQVFCPDYCERAQELYEDYKLHAVASAVGDKDVQHKKHGRIPVNHGLVDDLDRYRLGKPKGSLLDEEDKKFRKGLPSILSDRKDEYVVEQLSDLSESEATDEKRKQLRQEFQENWETIPELANAIRAKLDSEVAEAIEKLLSEEVTSNLKREEMERLEKASKLLEELGYPPESQKSILEYAKKVKVWAHKS